MKPLVILEMNEINYDFVHSYIAKGKLKNFHVFFERHGYSKTKSETSYELLEPWIQWISARTGKTFKEHGVFRLGDIVNSDLKQYWEIIEEGGYEVAAVSPINGANKTRNSPFWIPDPWVDTHVSGDKSLQEVFLALKQAVNDNASSRLSMKTLYILSRTLLTHASRGSWKFYAKYIFGIAKNQHWSKALVLDRLLADVFFSNWSKYRPDFSTLFLNSAAHIQHHYMYNSTVYEGSQKNPTWYIKRDADPILEVYELYDSIIGYAVNLGCRVIVATGLRQLPFEKITYYYRLSDHEEFLNKLGICYKRVLPRMSRDFLVEFDDSESAEKSGRLLSSLFSNKNEVLFDVDNRGKTLFVTLVFPKEIASGFTLFDKNGSSIIEDFSKDVSFVAIKNGHHDALGYYMDTNLDRQEAPESMRIEDIFYNVLSHFDCG